MLFHDRKTESIHSIEETLKNIIHNNYCIKNSKRRKTVFGLTLDQKKKLIYTTKLNVKRFSILIWKKLQEGLNFYHSYISKRIEMILFFIYLQTLNYLKVLCWQRILFEYLSYFRRLLFIQYLDKYKFWMVKTFL